MSYGDIGIYSLLIPLIAGLVYFKRKNKLLKYFLGFIVFSIFIEALNSIIGKVYNNNLWVFKLFLICDFIFFSWYYNNVFHKPIWPIVINVVFITLIFILEVLGIIFPELNSLLSWFHFMLFVFFIVQSAWALIIAFKNFEDHIFHYPVFWISFARLFYFLIIVIIFVYPKIIDNEFKNEIISRTVANINTTANICLNVLYSFAFLCLRIKK